MNGARRLSDLPDNARRYIARLEEVSGVPAAIVSTGSDREDTILRDELLRVGLRGGAKVSATHWISLGGRVWRWFGQTFHFRM